MSKDPSDASNFVRLEHAGQFATQNLMRYDDGFRFGPDFRFSISDFRFHT